jgi:RNA polymerase sigma-70 factor, ECF subfamily
MDGHHVNGVECGAPRLSGTVTHPRARLRGNRCGGIGITLAKPLAGGEHVREPDDERQWVLKAQSGDSEAVGWLYERYFSRIYKYCYLKLGDPTEAEDITEGVFLKMIEAISTFRWQGSSFASWLYRIAHNQVVDLARQRTRRPQTSLEPVGESLPSEKDDPHGAAEMQEAVAHLQGAIGSLTDLQAQVILLKFGSDMTNAQVAEVLERSEGAVKALQHSALQNMNKWLNRRGFTWQDGAEDE